MSKRSEKDNAVRYRMKGERRAALLEIIDSQPFTSLHELEAAFPGVSGMIIRRDLDTFEEQGRIIKSRGGAKSMKFVMNAAEENFSERLRTNKGAKDLISRRAVEFIEPGRSIFFDSGTTMLRVAELLSDRRITVTTSGLNVALELMKKEHKLKHNTNEGNTSDKKYQEALMQIADLHEKAADLEEKYYEKMCKAISPKKVFAIIQADDAFHREMLQRFGRGNEKPRPRK